MHKILTVQKSIEIAKNLRSKGKKIVLAGGCFDILHIGHITFLKKAKEAGDSLFILLESDEAIKRIKGKNRPINNQEDRAKILAALNVVDFVVLLPANLTDKDYDRIVIQIKPAIIATTKGDPFRMHKERQAVLINCKIIDVTDIISDQSTSRLVKLLKLGLK